MSAGCGGRWARWVGAVAKHWQWDGAGRFNQGLRERRLPSAPKNPSKRNPTLKRPAPPRSQRAPLAPSTEPHLVQCFRYASAHAMSSSRSANAISGSIIQNSARWRAVLEFSALWGVGVLGFRFGWVGVGWVWVKDGFGSEGWRLSASRHVCAESQKWGQTMRGQCGRPAQITQITKPRSPAHLNVGPNV